MPRPPKCHHVFNPVYGHNFYIHFCGQKEFVDYWNKCHPEDTVELKKRDAMVLYADGSCKTWMWFPTSSWGKIKGGRITT